ncbi:MAG: hydroxymethylglutaryl-CoA lyase [bacterium]|nr:hydroxymethylglutaryl-CoA lyase [bacterium]
MKKKLPESVRIVEVGPRDGLQSIQTIISTQDKIHFIDLLSKAKLPEIEVTSFVSPQWVPQLKDGAEVFSKINKRKQTIYTALVPNRKGLERAMASGFQSIAVFVAASETFSKKNTNSSIRESFDRLVEMQPLWFEADLRVRGYISTCWHCPYEGYIEPSKVIPVIKNLFDLGIDEISLGDTIGKAEPDEVRVLLDEVLKRWSVSDFALHFHDTYNKALKNVDVGLEYGINIYDTSAGGVGGCPFAPGAGGNLATEKLVYFLEEKNILTNLDTNYLSQAVDFIQKVITRENGKISIQN